MKGGFLFAFITEEYNILVNSDKLIGTTEYLTIWARCLIYRCRYKRVQLYLDSILFTFLKHVVLAKGFFYAVKFNVSYTVWSVVSTQF